MKGIILAGGDGTRLHPMTKVVTKHILPVYNKPMIYYPLSILMLMEIQDIMIIGKTRDIKLYRELFGDGSTLGINITYASQDKARGIAEAFIIAKDFIDNSSVALILADNIFYTQNLHAIKQLTSLRDGAHVLLYRVDDPSRYGVASFDADERLINIEEKPQNPKSNWVATGLYFYDNNVVKMVEYLKPSARGELEITDLNNMYLNQGKLKYTKLGRGTFWIDLGTPDSLLEAASFIHTIEKRQGLKVADIEEISLQMNPNKLTCVA